MGFRRQFFCWFYCLALAIISASCNYRKVAYNHADWILMHKLDGYFDLTSQQEDALELRVDKQLDHIDKRFLPEFAALMGEFQSLINKDGFTESDLDFFKQNYIKLRIEFFDVTAEDIASTILGLSADQMQHFSAELDESNEDYEELLELSDDKMRAKYVEQKVKRLEEWFDDMNDQQLVALEKVYDITREQLDAKLNVRKGFHKAMLGLHGMPKDAAVARIKKWAKNPESVLPPEAAKTYLESWDVNNKELLATDAVMTGEQRRFFDKKLSGFIAELKQMKRKSK